MYESDVYSSLAGLTYTAADAIVVGAVPGSNTSAGNYSATKYGFDAEGRQNHAVDPNGTITDTTLDGLGRVTSTSIGTNDTTANNMVDVEDDQYDNGGVGDGNLTETIQHPGGGAADRVTLNLYDWRDRLIASKQGALLDSSGNPNPTSETDGAHRLITFNSYDNLNELTAARTYAGDGVSLTDFGTWTSSTNASDLRGYAAQAYDAQGRVYLAQTYSVDPATGAIGASLATSTFYDHRGNVIETAVPGGIVTKDSYDGAGRDTKDSTTDGGVINGAAQDWANAMTTANDVVIEQTLNSYDADNNLTQAVDRQRFNNDPTNSAGTGDLAGPSGGSLSSRDYYTASYYDAANRLTDSVNVGTNDGVVWARPSTVPPDSDTVLVTHTDYDAAGNVRDTMDPRGIVSGTFYDLAGRQIETIAAWDGTQNPMPTDSANQVTQYGYDATNDVLTMTAVMPSGTPSQTTAYIYGVGATAGTDLFSNDLLKAVEYPDPATGAASTSASHDQSFTYNWQQGKATFSDHNGTTHAYSYDPLGRLTADTVTAFGSGVDQTVKRLGYSFDSAGRPFQQTSYSDTAGTIILDQVQDQYNGYGQLVTDYQSVSGAVNTSSTPGVQYVYSQPTGANYSRQTAMIYPNGRQLDYIYNANINGIDDAISRLDELADETGAAAGADEYFWYLGLSTPIHQEEGNGIELNYVQVPSDNRSNLDGGDMYVGLDRFGRVVDQNWLNVHQIGVFNAPPPSIDRVQYQYDRDGNVLYMNNLVSSADSELYHANGVAENASYDSLNRLTQFARGTLSASLTNGSTLDQITSPSVTNNWNLDALGNWTGTGSQARTSNAENEITGISGATTPSYDNNGNRTQDDTGKRYVFDAWDRIAQVQDSAGTLQETYGYDAQNRRTIETPAGGTATDLYLDTNGNVIEQRQGSSVTTEYVWSPVYVNAMLLRDDNSVSGSLGLSGSGLGRRLYVEQDANWDVTALTDASGNVVERFEYDPYGARTVVSPTWTATTDSYNWMYGFQGGRMDPVSGMVHFGARDYSTTLGNWMQQDPAGYVDGLNRYQFDDSSPTSLTDPSGLGPGPNRPNFTTTLPEAREELYDLEYSWYNGGNRRLAAEMLHHFLSNTGSTYQLTERDVTRLQGNATFKAPIEDDIVDHYWEKLGPSKSKVNVKGDFRHYFHPYEDWELFFAFGTLHITYDGTACVNSAGGLNYDLHVKVSKNYNFSPTTHSSKDYKFATFNDAWLLESHKLAHSFDINGEFDLHKQQQ